MAFFYFQMFFNCWTLCQKSGFSDKKQNMCLRTKLTGPGLEDLIITKTINVQQNPGRGAKVSLKIMKGEVCLLRALQVLLDVIEMCITAELQVVCPKTRVYPYQQQKTYNIDGTHGKSTIKLKIKFALGKC